MSGDVFAIIFATYAEPLPAFRYRHVFFRFSRRDCLIFFDFAMTPSAPPAAFTWRAAPALMLPAASAASVTRRHAPLMLAPPRSRLIRWHVIFRLPALSYYRQRKHASAAPPLAAHCLPRRFRYAAAMLYHVPSRLRDYAIFCAPLLMAAAIYALDAP